MIMSRFIYTLLMGLLLVGCSKEAQIDSPSELVAIDFVCDEITTRAGEDDSFMFTLVGDGNSGKPVSDEYSYVEGTLTATSKILAANNLTYKLVIASPATEMVAIDDTESSAYGYKIERKRPSDEQTYINTEPISVYVWGILAEYEYIYELYNVTLHEQRSKVKVQFKVPANDSRIIKKLYYSDLYDVAYTCPYSGLLYGDNQPNNKACEFKDFSNGEGEKTYTNTESMVEPTVLGDGVTESKDGATYFISGDYSNPTKENTPKLCIGLLQDGEERLIEMGLNIKMEPMTTYTYNIEISSTALTIHVTSTDVWDGPEIDDSGIDGVIDDVIVSYKINIATGVVSELENGCIDDGGDDGVDAEIEQPDATVETEIDYTDEEVYKSSNCYILNPSENETMVYYIPVRRIDEFWGDSDYVTNGTRNTLSSVGDKWEAVIFWHDFSGKSADAISKLKVEKSVSPNTGKAAVKVTLPKEFYIPKNDYGYDNHRDNHCNVGYVVRRTDTKEVLWSWHLWITDYNPYQTPKDGVVYSEDKFSVVGGELHRYKGDIFTTGIYIMDRNIGARNRGNSEDASLGSLYYQYGRKDPLPISVLYANGYVSGSSLTQQSFEYSVNNPEKFIIKSDNWCNSVAAQSTDYIWNDYKIKVDGYETGKSIFDPSPLGFRVPVYGTWSDFNTDTFKYNSFFGGYNYNGNTVYAPYPALGCRTASSGKFDSGINGCWSATPASNMNGYNLNFKTDAISNSAKSNRAYGYCVRPIQE